MATRSINEVVLAYLARREYSRLELEQRLLVKKFSGSEIEQCLDLMQERGYQSEARYAESYAHHRASAGVGPLKICAELRQRGVFVDSTAACFQSIDWDERLADVWSKKFEHPPADQRSRAKQMRFLLQRGFEPARVQRLLNQN